MALPPPTETTPTAENYSDWRDNCSKLYDLLLCRTLEWPSMTLQWLAQFDMPSPASPLSESSRPTQQDNDVDERLFLMATDVTPPAPNVLKVMGVQLPTAEIPAEHRSFQSLADYSGFHYGDHRNKFTSKFNIPHIGAPHRARQMPQQTNIVATIGDAGPVALFDLSRALALGSLSNSTIPGWGLAWSPTAAGKLASVADDGFLSLWDAATAPAAAVSSGPAHHSVSQDVVWHHGHQHLLFTAGDDGRICVWDDRQPIKRPAQEVMASERPVNSIDTNPNRPTLIATGLADGNVVLRDVRKLEHQLQRMVNHEGQVYSVSFCPETEHYIASGGEDRRVNIWDLRRIGAEQSPNDADEAPPEHIFQHAGHTGFVTEVDWLPDSNSLTLASISQRNELQIWQPCAEALHLSVSIDDILESVELE